MKTIRIILLTLLSTVTLFASAQRKYLQEGDDFYKRRMYLEAIASYKLALQEDVVVKKFYMTQQIAKTYKRLFDYKNAAEWYGKLMEFKDDNTAENMFEYAEILMNLEQYDKAAEIFKAYCIKSGKPDLAGKYAALCKWPKDNAGMSKSYNTYRTNIETGGRSMGVAIYNNGIIYALPQNQDYAVKTTYYDLAFASAADSINFGTSVVLPGETNRSFYEGTPFLSADGKFLYFTSNATETEKFVEGKKKKAGISSSGMNVLHIYRAEKVNDSWKHITELNVNSEEYNCAFPSLSADGKTLYFSSDMPGGFGGFDLYMSTLTNDGKWSAPKNLGTTVNTDRDEFYPYVYGDKFYFSSRGLPGFGGADIYEADLKEGIPGNARNMGKPFNSPKDDFSFIMSTTGKAGYFSSNRDGETGYDHIYYFKKKFVPDTLRGLVKDKITDKPVEGVKVELLLIAEDGSESVVNSLMTPKNGKWEFLIDPEKNYRVRYTLNGYETEERTVSSINKVGELDRNEEKKKLSPVYMKPIVKKDNIVRIDNIYFDFDKASIQPESYPILDNIVKFLQENPEARIELSAHTDAVGNDAYNLGLSKKRAQSCFDYLVSKGISPSRLVPVGYGETRLLNKCKKKDDCPEEQHAINRRVEVKFL